MPSQGGLIHTAGHPCSGWKILVSSNPTMPFKEVSELLRMFKTGLVSPSLLERKKVLKN
jgi:hypothetical protein